MKKDESLELNVSHHVHVTLSQIYFSKTPTHDILKIFFIFVDAFILVSKVTFCLPILVPIYLNENSLQKLILTVFFYFSDSMALIQHCFLITLTILVSVNIGANANDVICSEFSNNCFTCVHQGSPCHYVIFDNKSSE